MKKNRLLGLEVIRFMAACGVLFVHYDHFSHIDPNSSWLTNYPFIRYLPFLYALGGEWTVQTFWCLSGFIFFWKYQSLIKNRAINFKDFFVSRFARLYPLHILTFFIVAIGQSVYFHMTGIYFLHIPHSALLFVSQLFMAGNRIFIGDSYNFPSWSVSAELLIYLIFFIVTRYLITSIRFNIFVVLLFIVIRSFDLLGRYSLFFECLLFFYTGGMAAILKRYSVLNNFSYRWVWIGAGLIPIIFWFAGAFSSDNTIFLFLAIWLPMLMYCASDDYKGNELVRKTIETLGNMTYSSYLIHVPIQLLFAIYCFPRGIRLPVNNPLFFIGYLVLILFLSYFVYRYFELPMKKMIKGRAGLKP